MKLSELFENFSKVELISIAKTVGEELFGKSSSGLVFGNTVKIMPFSNYLDEDDNAIVDTFDFVFFPSTKTGVDVSDQELTKSHIDVDGKIYIGGAGGVKVLTDPFKQAAYVFPKHHFEKFRLETLKHFSDAVFTEPDKWNRVFATNGGKMVGQFLATGFSRTESEPSWLIYDSKNANNPKVFAEHNWK